MPVITLTTDWGFGNLNLAQLKARLHSFNGNLQIVDIDHSIASFNYVYAAFVVKSVYALFPKGSIHIIGVNSEPSPKNELVVMLADGHYFIGSNSGVMSLVWNGFPDKLIVLPVYDNFSAFKALPTFCKAVEIIISGGNIDVLGKTCELKKDFIGQPSYFGYKIQGQVIYVDSFGNVVTNIERKMFEKLRNNRQFEILPQNNFHKIIAISEYYDDVKRGKMLAIFNSLGLLEMAVNEGNFSKLFSMDVKSSVVVNFIENKF